MDSTLKVFLESWNLRLDVIAVLIFFGLSYAIGWLRLRNKQSKLATNWRIASYYAGLALLAIALLSGIDTFQTQLFFIHMIQHLLLFMLAPPLLLLGNPMPFLIWAFPRTERLQVARLLTRKSLFRKILVGITAPAIIWFIYASNLGLWHDPNPYQEAIENDFIHDIEHLSFFLTGIAFWWHITNAAPKFHGRRSYTMRMAFVALTYFANLILGITITMSGNLIYDHYATVPRLWGISPLRDQTIGGLIMWIPGGMMYLMVFLILLFRLVKHSEERARLTDKQRKLKMQSASLS